MAIVNRDLDASQQKDTVTFFVGAQATGVTFPMAILPYPATLQSVRAVCVGISGAPSISFFNVAASGITLRACSISPMIIASVGTSGAIGYSGLQAVGHTSLNFAANGILMGLTDGGSGAAYTGACFEIVFKKTQDIVSHNGVSS